MALQQRTVLGKVTINHASGGHCETQYVNEVYDDVSGEIISSNFHRLVVDPDDDTQATAAGVNNISGGAWIPEIRAAQQTLVVFDDSVANENAANAAAAADNNPANQAAAAAANAARVLAENENATAQAALKVAITVVIP